MGGGGWGPWELTMKAQAGLKAKVPQEYRWVALTETSTRMKLKHCVWGRQRIQGLQASRPKRPSPSICPPHPRLPSGAQGLAML